MSGNLADRLEALYQEASVAGDNSFLSEKKYREAVHYICHVKNNKAGSRLVMACMAAKIEDPKVDPRMPYTEIRRPGAFSGRVVDEQALDPLIHRHKLPCNPTTAFLTPALRNHDAPLTAASQLVGKPPEMYRAAIDLLEGVASKAVQAEDVLREFFRVLVQQRNAREARMRSLVEEIDAGEGDASLSVEEIVTLLRQHLASPHSSRLPVLIVAAAYDVVADVLGEYCVPLKNHLSADRQSKAIGDIEVCLSDSCEVVTAFEMKHKAISRADIDRAIQKIASAPGRIDNYIFVSTEPAEDDVVLYASEFYRESGGIEISILDCISFARHFLHLFCRRRERFLDRYQELVLAEPESAVRSSLKESFLALRRDAESAQ